MRTLALEVHALPGFHEPIAALSHLVGALVFVALSVPLLRRARGDARRVAFLAVYALACVFLLAMSGVYLLLGWIAGMAGIVVWRRYGTAEIRLLIIGGLVYSAGAILLGLEWPTLVPGVVGPHELWHFAVLTAMGLHWKFLFDHARRDLDRPGVLTDAHP